MISQVSANKLNATLWVQMILCFFFKSCAKMKALETVRNCSVYTYCNNSIYWVTKVTTSGYLCEMEAWNARMLAVSFLGQSS